MTSVPLASLVDAVSFSPDVPRPMAVAAPTCLRVLVAEDQPLLRRLMVRTIERLGHEAVAAEDGAQAWELFTERPADVVITDWLMPEMDGLALCRRLRAEGAESYPYVILASVLDDPRDVQSGLSAGADEYLIKPIATAALEARLIAVEHLLRDHGREHTVAGGERLLQFTSGPTEAESEQPLPRALAAVIRQLEFDVEALYRASIWTDSDGRDAHDLWQHGR